MTSSNRSASKFLERRRRREHVAFGAVVLLGSTIGHDDDHRHGFAVGDQVVHDHLGLAEPMPLGFVAADAVQKIEHGILLAGRVIGRRVHVHVADGADGLGVVLDHLQLAVRNVVADGLEVGRRIVEGWLVVGT